MKDSGLRITGQARRLLDFVNDRAVTVTIFCEKSCGAAMDCQFRTRLHLAGTIKKTPARIAAGGVGRTEGVARFPGISYMVRQMVYSAASL